VSIKSSLERLKTGTHPLHFNAPRPEYLPTVVEKLAALYGENGHIKANSRDLEALLQRLRAVDFVWAQVTPRDRLDVAWVLWHGAWPPAEHPAFLDGFLTWLDSTRSSTQLRRLASSWAEACDPNLVSIGTVSRWIGSRLADLPEPWQHLGREYSLFSLDRGPRQLAEAFLDAIDPAEDFLERIQLRGRAVAGGLILECLIQAAELTESRLRQQQSVAHRLIALSMHQGIFRPAARVSGTSNRAWIAKLKLAEALLLPWSNHEPATETKEQIIDHLLRHYRDARLHQAVWEDLRPPARDTMRRWLSAETIEAFFRLMNDMQIENPHHWRRRRKFWMAYLDHIDHAWLVAGRQGAELADGSKLSFGRLSGVRADHCVLMITIRGMTIVDWNHAGSVRIWQQGDPNAPSLYKGTHGSRYCREDLVTPSSFECRHAGNDDGRWQDRVYDEIRRYTGITLRREEYF